jgi:hypothetical protein
MSKQITTLIFLLLAQYVTGQSSRVEVLPYKPLTKKVIRTENKNQHCIEKKDISFSVRLQEYPFSQTSQIQLVSFSGGYKNDEGLPLENDTVCYSKFIEVKQLTLTQIDSSTLLLYNFGFGGPVQFGSTATCFNPRNAILFLDTTGKVFDYVEICFECNEMIASSEKIYLGQKCSEKMEMLKTFFKGIGLKHGTQ